MNNICAGLDYIIMPNDNQWSFRYYVPFHHMLTAETNPLIFILAMELVVECSANYGQKVLNV